MSAYPNLHLIAYGTGGQRLNRSELAVEAADALERLDRTCATCAWFKPHPEAHRQGVCAAADIDGPDAARLLVSPSHACNAWQPLTPAHDKEKS